MSDKNIICEICTNKYFASNISKDQEGWVADSCHLFYDKIFQYTEIILMYVREHKVATSAHGKVR